MSKSQRPDARGGTFQLMPHCLLKSEAWRTASYRARAALIVLCLKHNGFNNGSIALSSADLADGLGCRNFSANSAAIGELCARGIIEMTKNYPRGVRLAREYRITFIPTATASATHDYLHWKPGDAGTRRKNRLAKTANETCVSSVAAANETKLSIAAAANGKNASDGKPPKFPSPSLAITTAHIVSHSRGSPAPLLKHGGNANGPQTAVSAAPALEDIRARAVDHVEAHGRGSQGRLARAAGIPVGTFSKFINNGGPLNERARIRLACAFPKTEAAERKGERISA